MKGESASREMSAVEVVRLYNRLESIGVATWIDGGWGVDALLGKQTRPHGDLDIALQQKDVSLAVELLKGESYKEIRRDNEWNFVLADDDGHEVDFHSFVWDENQHVIAGIAYPDGSLNGTGTILGQSVRCIDPEHMVRFHTGYPPKATDYGDVAALCERFKIKYPPEYTHLQESR